MPLLEPVPTAPAFAVPARACDVHAHVCGPAERYPYWEGRLYTPEDVTAADFRRMLDRLGIERGVLVQPSVHALDNRPLLDGLASDPQRLRGVCGAGFDIEPAEIERLHAAGVRGVRCNIVDIAEGKGQLPLEPLRGLAHKVQPYGWHLEFLLHVNEFPQLDTQLADFPVDVVFGHLGYVPAKLGTADPGFQALLRLLRAGKAWVKLTAPYRLTPDPAPWEAADAFAHELVAAAPERLLWGSDWPHVMFQDAMPNDGDLLNTLARWVPDDATRNQILVENPARLYDFAG